MHRKRDWLPAAAHPLAVYFYAIPHDISTPNYATTKDTRPLRHISSHLSNNQRYSYPWEFLNNSLGLDPALVYREFTSPHWQDSKIWAQGVQNGAPVRMQRHGGCVVREHMHVYVSPSLSETTLLTKALERMHATKGTDGES